MRSLGVTTNEDTPCTAVISGNQRFPDVPADDNTPIFLAVFWFHGPCVINPKTLPAEVSLRLRSLTYDVLSALFSLVLSACGPCSKCAWTF